MTSGPWATSARAAPRGTTIAEDFADFDGVLGTVHAALKQEMEQVDEEDAMAKNRLNISLDQDCLQYVSPMLAAVCMIAQKKLPLSLARDPRAVGIPPGAASALVFDPSRSTMRTVNSRLARFTSLLVGAIAISAASASGANAEASGGGADAQSKRAPKQSSTLIVTSVRARWLRVRPVGASATRGQRLSCGRASLDSYALHPAVPVVILRCVLWASCPEEGSLCNPFSPEEEHLRLFHAKSGKWLPIPDDFSFSPGEGHAFFAGRDNGSVDFVRSSDLPAYIDSRRRRGAHKIKLSQQPLKSMSLPDDCPWPAERKQTLEPAGWLEDGSLRLIVRYCIRYQRLADHCPARNEVRLAGSWQRRPTNPPVNPPSACSEP